MTTKVNYHVLIMVYTQVSMLNINKENNISLIKPYYYDKQTCINSTLYRSISELIGIVKSYQGKFKQNGQIFWWTLQGKKI